MLFVWWCCLHLQNPNYMKENFSIVIESYHIADRGTQENVSVLKIYWHKIISTKMFTTSKNNNVIKRLNAILLLFFNLDLVMFFNYLFAYALFLATCNVYKINFDLMFSINNNIIFYITSMFVVLDLTYSLKNTVSKKIL